MKSKRFVRSFIAISTMMAILTGCSTNSGNAVPNMEGGSTTSSSSGAPLSEVGTYPLSDETIEISILAPADGTNERELNAFTKELEEKMNIKITWNIASPGSFKEKMTLMFSGGDMTDIIMTGPTKGDRLDQSTEAQLGDQGLIIPLNQFIKESSIGFKQVLENEPELEKIITAPDGNIYTLPNVDGSFHMMYPQKMWLNTTWLDNLGLEMPTTTEEFYHVLKAFKEQDANGNGDPNDEIPLSTVKKVAIDSFLMNSFILTPNDKLWVNDEGKVIYSPIEEEYKEGLKYINKLYAEGLINPESFTQEQKNQININENGDQAVIGAFPALHLGYACNISSSPKWEEYQAVPPLEGPSGQRVAPYSPYDKYQTGVVAITSSCKNPEAAFRVIDYIYTEEGTTRAYYGREGKEWAAAGADEKGLDGEAARYTPLQSVEKNISWGQLGGIYRSSDYLLDWAVPQDPYAEGVDPMNGRNKVFYDASKLQAEYSAKAENVLPPLFFTPEEIKEIALLQATITDFSSESLVSFVIGNNDLEKGWDKYVQEMKNIGIDRYIEIYQAAYDRFKTAE